MTPAKLVSLGCLAMACWMGSVSHADACSCSSAETLVARDASVAVFEGTVVDRGLLLCVLFLQFVAAIIFVSRRRLRRSLLLLATSAMTIVVLFLWTGHALASRPEMSDLLSWR